MERYKNVQGDMDVMKTTCGGRTTCQRRHGFHLLHMMQSTERHIPLVMGTSRLGRCLKDACVWMAEDVVR